MVFYRKYRPSTIDELDSKEVREKLSLVLSKDDVHALLFTGPKGLGKTSAARIVAKIINCEKIDRKTKHEKRNTKLEPCNKCDQCTSITNGSNIDVLEIDGASNRGIDEIRDLREKLKLSPARSRKKVYIIDEVHMLTSEAFNALLKTLEEPPGHVVFILCTTEPHKVPATIASRCFHIPFKRATDEELVRAFSRISKKEKIKIDKDALFEIAKFSDGSFRDGVKVLEELAISAHGRKITKEFTQKSYQTFGINKTIDEMIDSLITKDIKRGVTLVGNLVENGSDLKYFLEALIERFHNILLEKVGVLKVSSRFADKLEMDELKELIEKLSQTSGKMKFSVLPQLPLEIAIIEWGIGPDDTEIVEKQGSGSGVAGPAARHLVGAHSPTGGLRATKASGSRHPLSDKDENILLNLIDRVKTENHSVAGFLRGCSVKDLKNSKLILEAKFKFHKEKLEEEKASKIIEKALKEITDKNLSVSFVLKS